MCVYVCVCVVGLHLQRDHNHNCPIVLTHASTHTRPSAWTEGSGLQLRVSVSRWGCVCVLGAGSCDLETSCRASQSCLVHKPTPSEHTTHFWEMDYTAEG